MGKIQLRMQYITTRLAKIQLRMQYMTTRTAIWSNGTPKIELADYYKNHKEKANVGVFTELCLTLFSFREDLHLPFRIFAFV